eukprot:jgi/Orpsp1_1/1176892/evm.model.c7180000059410.1
MKMKLFICPVLKNMVKKESIILLNNNLHKKYMEEEEKDFENDEAYYAYILQKNRKNKFKGRTMVNENSNKTELTEQQQDKNQEKQKTENEEVIDNEMSYLDNGNKTVTIYKDTKNTELKVKDVEKEDKESKLERQKSSSAERSFKKKLLRYERKQVKKEIEASEKRS